MWLALCTAAAAWASEEAHGAGGDHGDPLLTPKLINFAILAAGLGYLFVKFAFPAFREQQQQILDSMSQASKQAEKVAEQARAVDARIANLNLEIEALRAKSLSEMRNEANRLEEETAAAMKKLELGAEAELASAAKSAKKDLAVAAAAMALELAQQKVRERMTPPVQANLVDRFTAKLEEERA
jgi:F0F1-type ATP synthase membrane subunit b/b'